MLSEPVEAHGAWSPASDNEAFWTGSRVARLVFALVMVAVMVITITAGNPSSTTYSPSAPTGNFCNGIDCGTAVNVTAVYIVSSDNACGLNGARAGAFSTGSNAMHPVSWWLPLNGAPIPCQVESMTSETPGFSLFGNVPLNVTGDQTPLLVSIYTPAYYNGTLTISFE